MVFTKGPGTVRGSSKGREQLMLMLEGKLLRKKLEKRDGRGEMVGP